MNILSREIIDLDVNKVSVVGRPANKRKFLLLKSEAEEKDIAENKENGGEEKMAIKADLLTLLKEQGAEIGIDKITEALKEAGLELPIKTVEVEKKTVEKKDPINKAELPAAVQELIQKMETDAAESKAKAEEAQEMAKSEKTLRVKKETVDLVKSDMNYITSVKQEDLIDYLIKNDDEFVRTILKGANTLLKESAIYMEVGKTGVTGGTDASKKSESMAKELMKSDSSLTLEQAEERILEQNPELYKEYKDEKAGE